MPISSVGSSGSYEHQLEIILSQELKVEDLQTKLINNGGSYAAMIKNEEQIKVKFAELMKTKYPELSGFTADQIVDMINKVPEILVLDGKISEALGEYSSIAELQDALNQANTAVDTASADLATKQAELDNAIDLLASADERVAIAEARIVTRTTELQEAIVAYNADPTEENLALIQTAQDNLAAARRSLENAQRAQVFAEGFYNTSQAAFDIAKATYDAAVATRDDLKERFDLLVDLNAQRDAFISGNVVYALYSSFSDTEKELIDHFTS